MAITNRGTNLRGRALKEATDIGATIPAITYLSDFTHKRKETFDLVKATYDESAKATTFNAIVAAVDAAMDTETGNDLDEANTVTTYYELNNVELIYPESEKYTNVAPFYRCHVTIYIKVA